MSLSAAVPLKSAAQAMQIPTRVQNPRTGQFIPLSSTPGGSLYGTTPGGTRIQYDRNSLLNYRNSPLSKSPAAIPHAILNLGVTGESAPIKEEKLKATSSHAESTSAASTGKTEDQDEDLFEME